MTTRLLARTAQASAPRTVRDALQAASLTTVLRIGDIRVSGAALPLFRAASPGRWAGALDQVVRLAFTSRPHGLDRVELRRPDGDLAVTWTGDLPPDGALDLLVPEITAPATWQVVVVADGHQHTGPLAVAPGPKLTIHVVHHSHLVFDHPDLSARALRHHWDSLDAVVELARDDARGEGSDPETAFRFTVDANLPARAWLRQRPTVVVEEFCRLARAGLVEVTALPFSPRPEVASEGEIVSLLRSAVELRERYRLPVRSALQTGAPGGTAGFVDCLVEAGVRYLSTVGGSGGALAGLVGRSDARPTDAAKTSAPAGGSGPGRLFWWRSPGGARLLTWATDGAAAHLEGNLLGLADSYDAVLALLPLYLHAFTRQHSFDVLPLRVQGHRAANAGPSDAPSRIARRWNAEWAYPRLVSATNASFLTQVERLLGDQVAEHVGDWCVPAATTSDARLRGYHRHALELTRTAETVHVFADLRSDASVSVHDRVDAIHERAGSFDAPGANATRKGADAAWQAYDDASDLLHHGVRRLGASIGRSPFSDVRASFAVYNTTGWSRTDVVRAFVPDYRLSGEARAFGVVDTRRDERVPARVTPSRGEGATRGYLVEFVAREVPALGWVRFDLVSGGEDERPRDMASMAGPTGEEPAVRLGAGDNDPSATTKAAYRLSNEYYELTYDTARAMVTSIVDRRTGHELVNQAALTGLNEYVVDTYARDASDGFVPVQADDGTLLASRRLGRPAIVRAFESSELRDQLDVEVRAPNSHVVRTTIALYAGVPRVDITNRVQVPAAATRECGYFAFPLAGSGTLVYERTGAVAGQDRPHVPGATAGPLAIRHWAGARDEGYVRVWATLEAPNVQIGTLVVPSPPYPTTIAHDTREPSTIYSSVYDSSWVSDCSVYGPWRQGRRAHPSRAHATASSSGGTDTGDIPPLVEMTFRYAVAGALGSSVPALGAATAAGLTDPLVAVLATGRGQAPPVSSGGLLALRHPDVVVSGLGRPRDGSAGVAVRLRSLASHPVEVEVTLEGIVARSAVLTTPLEHGAGSELPVVDGRVRVPIPAGTIRTLLLRP